MRAIQCEKKTKKNTTPPVYAFAIRVPYNSHPGLQGRGKSAEPSPNVTDNEKRTAAPTPATVRGEWTKGPPFTESHRDLHGPGGGQRSVTHGSEDLSGPGEVQYVGGGG